MSPAIGSIIGLGIDLVPQILADTGTISPGLANLISQLGQAVPGIVTALTTKKSVPDEATAVLTALRGEVAVLQADTNLSPQTLQMVNDLLEAIDDALAADENATRVTDPSTLKTLPTDL